jgi:sulfite exporter TauE/SafE
MIWAGFLMGFLGSLHCVGMCGPIALALPVQTQNMWMRITAATIYNMGRVVTYSILGSIFGLIGTAFNLIGLQQILSIISGVVLIIAILFPFVFRTFSPFKSFFDVPYLHQLKQRISNQLKTRSFLSLFVIGILNGLLPCGLVSLAIIGAIATGNVLQSSLYMALFGLGTLPIMMVLIISKNYLSVKMKLLFQQTVPVFVCGLGVLLILRGMNLGIPYLSPSAEKSCCTPQQHACH